MQGCAPFQYRPVLCPFKKVERFFGQVGIVRRDIRVTVRIAPDTKRAARVRRKQFAAQVAANRLTQNGFSRPADAENVLFLLPKGASSSHTVLECRAGF